MKELSIGNKYGRKYSKGGSILEVLIAIAVLTLSISAAAMLVFSNQSIALDSDTVAEALYKAKTVLENARAKGRENFVSLASTPPTGFPGSIYTKKLDIFDITPCRKEITSTITWSAEVMRPQTLELITNVTDIKGARDLGIDCPGEEPEGGWDNPQRFASDTLNPGKTTAIDVLDRIAYLGADKEPYLYIADTRTAILHQIDGMLIGITSNKYNNDFNKDGDLIDVINDIDVFKDSSTNKVYALIAMASSTAQFAIVDVTDIHNPNLLAVRKLNNVVPGGMTSHGYRIYYYDKKAYIVTRETAGPEFHIIDVSTPSNPTELGSGTKLTGPTPPNGTTVNDLTVRDGIVYFAAEKEAAELLVYKISNPLLPVFMPGATVNLPGSKDAFSIFHSGSRLYLGREKDGSGPELYVFDATNPLAAVGGLPTVGVPEEIDASVIDIYTIGRFGFLVTDKPTEEFQVWNIRDASNITNIKKFNFGNIVAGGVDYEPDFIYATGDATPNFQILYSP